MVATNGPGLLTFRQSEQSWAICYDKFSVNLLLLRHQSRYLLEIFSICSSHVSARLTEKFLPLLNLNASHSRFRPKLRTALVTVFVEIFKKEKNWDVFRPIPVAHLEEFWISWKKWFFKIFQRSLESRWNFSCSCLGVGKWKWSFRSKLGPILAKIDYFSLLK